MVTGKTEYFALIENFINEYREKHGVSPSLREIGRGIGISYATVSRHLAVMVEQGIVEYLGPRRINTKQYQQINDETVKVPVLGEVACGIPKLAEENIEEFIRLPVALFGRGDFFILRAKGDSMVEAGIEDGDLVLIKQQEYADPGNIVVALIEDAEATLKRYFRGKNNTVILHPENSDMQDTVVDLAKQRFEIQGIAVKVIKDL